MLFYHQQVPSRAPCHKLLIFVSADRQQSLPLAAHARTRGNYIHVPLSVAFLASFPGHSTWPGNEAIASHMVVSEMCLETNSCLTPYSYTTSGNCIPSSPRPLNFCLCFFCWVFFLGGGGGGGGGL